MYVLYIVIYSTCIIMQRVWREHKVLQKNYCLIICCYLECDLLGVLIQ